MCLRCLYVTKEKSGNDKNNLISSISLNSLKIVESYGFIKQGSGPKCQDTYTIMPNLNQNTHFFSLYDGSGPQGQEVANKAESTMRSYVERSYKRLETLKSSEEFKRYLQEGFKLIEEELEASKLDYENSKSGASCVSALIYGNMAFIANVGNCRAALCTCKKDGIKVPVDLSYDHTLESGREKERCVRGGVKISATQPASKEHILGPERIWFNEEGPGFTTTRTLGCNKQGIISEPEIVNFEIKESDKFFVLGSDGLWDVLRSKEVIDIVDGISQRKNASEELVNQARKIWESEYGLQEFRFVGDDINLKSPDDISVVIVYVNRSK